MLRLTGKIVVDDAQLCLRSLKPPCIRSQILHRCVTTDNLSNKSAYSPPPRPRHVPNDARSSSSIRRTSSRNVLPPKNSDARSKHSPRSRSRKGEEQGMGKLKLLTPYKLSLQIKALCAEGHIDKAVMRLKTVPLDAQNVPVWNTLIGECVDAERLQLAYDVFTDMKRRGFSPNTGTYTALFVGLSRVHDWSRHQKQLAHAHSLYEYFLKHIESVKYHEPGNERELNITPITLYMKVLGMSGDFHKIFDVYFTMEKEGPLAPNKYTFTTMFQAIIERQKKARADEEVSVQNTAASDAKHVWMQMEKAIQKNPNLEPDAKLIGSALRALIRGRPTDQSFGLKVIRDYLWLGAPGESVPQGFSPHLDPYGLDAALHLCNAMQKHRLCIHFMKQLLAKNPQKNARTRELLFNQHILWMLKSYAALASVGSNESTEALEALEWSLENEAIYGWTKLRPLPMTYRLVLLTSYRCGDFATALRTFELMTGILPGGFLDHGGKERPVVEERSHGRNMFTNGQDMSYLLRAALSTKDADSMRQALWLADYLGGTKLLHSPMDPYYKNKLAGAMLDILDHLHKSVERKDDQLRRWISWKTEARDVMKAAKASDTPELEVQILGSDQSVAATDNYIAFEMATRNSKPRK